MMARRCHDVPGKRKAKRRERDFYRTPPILTETFLHWWRPRRAPLTVLEPAAGDGAMLGPLRARWPAARIDAFDVSPQSQEVVERTFFYEGVAERYDLIITNPPYSHALQFATRGLEHLAPGGHLVLLLRLNFLASRRRARFFREHLPERMYVIPERPTFTGGGTDWTDYAFFVWRHGPAPCSFKGMVML